MFYSLLCLLPVLHTVSASIGVTSTLCPGKTATVQNAINEAVAMAQNAVNIIGTADYRIQSLVIALLGPQPQLALPVVTSTFQAILDVDQSGSVNVACGDTFMRRQPNGDIWDTRDARNTILVRNANQLPFTCASSQIIAYALAANLIVLCDRAFGRVHGGDTIGSLRLSTPTPPYATLDSYSGLSGTLLHELLHISSNHRIGDYGYGYAQCATLAQINGLQASLNADTLTLLAIGLYFPNTNFAYGTGIALSSSLRPPLPPTFGPKRRRFVGVEFGSAIYSINY